MSGTDRKTCPFYDELDTILGTRAASSPPVLLDSGESPAAPQNTVDDGALCVVLMYAYLTINPLSYDR